MSHTAGIHVFGIDVGSPRNIGWADSSGRFGGGSSLGEELEALGNRLRNGERVALGFEAPIWTPRRTEFERLTSSRGGVEAQLRRPWSAGAGCGVLGAALALMPWTFTELFKASGRARATTSTAKFSAMESGLFVWEALITGTAKGTCHHEDAAAAVRAFSDRYPNLFSDVPAEPAMNHAVAALIVAGFEVSPEELAEPSLVVAGPC